MCNERRIELDRIKKIRDEQDGVSREERHVISDVELFKLMGIDTKGVKSAN